jgi:phospholipase/carboxylesterase
MQKIETTLFEHHFIAARRSSADGEKRLMIVLHGRGDSLRPFMAFDDELGLPEMNFLLLNGRRRLGLSGYYWCGLRAPEPGLRRVRARLAALLDELALAGWKPENVFLFGFSEGCLAGCDFAMSYPRRLGGVIGVSGCVHLGRRWQARLAKGARRTPWLFTHGLRDEVIRIDGMREDARRLRKAGLDVDWVETGKKHEIESHFELPLIKSWVRARLGAQRAGKSAPAHGPAARRLGKRPR